LAAAGPAGPPPAAGSAITQTEPKKANKGIRVLAVEDSFMVVSMLEIVFDSFGWTMVGPAARVSQALALIESETVDAALLDVNLDGEMSWEVASALQARGIPFVLSTGYEIAQLLPDGLKNAKFVRKPYNVDELEKAVLAALRNR
ncbi:MAG: response regulator, partial [Rhodospirillales bacterium]